MSSSSVVACQARDQLGGREPQQSVDRLVAGADARRRRRPARRRAGQPASSIASTRALACRLDPVDLGPGCGAVLGQAERLAQPRHRAGLARPELAGLEHGQHQVDQLGSPAGAAPSTWRPPRIWASLSSHR